MSKDTRVLRNSLIIDKAAPGGFLQVVRGDKTRELLDIAIGCMEPESDYIFTMHQDEQVDSSHVMIINTLSFKPLVRCHACEYFIDGEEECQRWSGEYHYAEHDGFCKWGERREDS